MPPPTVSARLPQYSAQFESTGAKILSSVIQLVFHHSFAHSQHHVFALHSRCPVGSGLAVKRIYNIIYKVNKCISEEKMISFNRSDKEKCHNSLYAFVSIGYYENIVEVVDVCVT